MINLFGKKENKNQVATIADLKGKTTAEVIEEIHETFYTEVDRLLASAKIANSLDTDKQELIDKCERLKAIGFDNTKEVREAEGEIRRLQDLKTENEQKKNLVNAINYFSFKYPNYKFITEESVKKICQKYNLIYGSIGRYIGTVPDENLKHIENFKVLEDDECYISETIAFFPFDGRERSFNKIHKTFSEYKEGLNRREAQMFARVSHGYSREINMKCPLEIAAPIKDFNTEGMEVKDFKLSKIEIPDPVVLKPVIFNREKYYLIVTAWGIEASDPMVVNPKHN
jgi:hypothetical protein